MATPKPTARRPSPSELRFPILLRALPDRILELLAQRSDVLRLPRGSRIVQTQKKRPYLLFVLEGLIQVQDPAKDDEQVDGGSTRSRFPLIAETSTVGECLCRSDCQVLRIPRELLDRVQRVAASDARADAEVKVAQERIEDRILLDFRTAIEGGKVELPSMPEVAVRIARHIDSPVSTSDSIARIVQMDPSVTARLIQVANSPAFGGRSRIETARDAVTRLGRAATRDLVTSFVLKGVFRARSPQIKAHMHNLWQHSIQVAALSHALARRCHGFDPAQALLIGLVHDIGIIPILAGAHQYPGVVEDDRLLQRVIDRLRADFSVLTLRQWGFADEFVEAAREAENWFRSKRQQVDYIDLLIMAQLHSYVGTPRMAALPRMDEVPAFRKLSLGGLSPRRSLLILDEARQEIDQIRQMIA